MDEKSRGEYHQAAHGVAGGSKRVDRRRARGARGARLEVRGKVRPMVDGPHRSDPENGAAGVDLYNVWFSSL